MDAYGTFLGLVPSRSSGTFVNQSHNASSTKAGWVFQSPKAITISRGLFRYGTRTGTPPTFRLSIQGVDGSGNPDGTVKGGGSPVSATFTPPADATWNSTIREITFANSYAATAGEFLALVLDYSSGTVDASNFSSVTLGLQTHDGSGQGTPYVLEASTGTYGKRTGEWPVYGIGDGTTYYGSPFQAVDFSTVNTAGNRAGMKFTLPSGWSDTFKVRGLRFYGRFSVASVNLKIGVWQGTTAMQTDTIDADYRAATSNEGNVHDYFFSSPVVLNTGIAYYAAIENTGGGSTVFLNTAAYSSSAHAASAYGGSQFSFATFNGTSWTDDATKRPHIGLIMDDISKAGVLRPLSTLSDLNIW